MLYAFHRRWLLAGVDSAVNLTSSTSPMNLAMPRLLSVWEASASRQTSPALPFTKPQVPDATTRSTWSVTRPPRPTGLLSKSPTARTSSPWSFATAGCSSTLRPRASTSLAGARQLQPSTTTAADSIPPLRIARPQHLQAQMKQALNPGKLNVVRSTAASPASSATSSQTSRLTGGVSSAAVAATADNGHLGSSSGPPTTPKLHATKSATVVNSDQSALVAVKFSVAERNNDTMPLNTLKVGRHVLLFGYFTDHVSCPSRAVGCGVCLSVCLRV